MTEELAGLDPGVRRVLEGASVAGDPFEPELAAAAAGVGEGAAVEALDELLHRDLVRLTDVPRRFRFRHPLVRHAVYESAPGGWRLAAHERCAAALAARGVPAAVRAHHVEHAARHGDAEAVAVLTEAGTAILARTPEGAARWFAAALRLLAANAPPEQRVMLLQALARALAATGRYDEARQAVLDALELMPDDAGDRRAGLVSLAAGIEGLLSRHAEARERLLCAGMLAGGALLAGLAGALVVDSWLDIVGGDWLANASALGLTVLAVAATVAGAHAVRGPRGIVLALLTMVLVGNPFSGAGSAPELLPEPVGGLGRLLPPGAGANLLRSTGFFDGAGGAFHVAVLAAWTLGGLALMFAAAASVRRPQTSGAPVPA